MAGPALTAVAERARPGRAGAVPAVLLGVRRPRGSPSSSQVSGLGRYAELDGPAAAERFIVGTLASVLWAAERVGVAVLLRS